MSHAVADCFAIENRGFINEGYYADLVVVDTNKPHKVTKENVFYKCGWSPLENFTFSASIDKTFVNGNLIYDNGFFNEKIKGELSHFLFYSKFYIPIILSPTYFSFFI